jgi:hypothetical protein
MSARLVTTDIDYDPITGLCGPADYADRGVMVLVDGVIGVEWSA